MAEGSILYYGYETPSPGSAHEDSGFLAPGGLFSQRATLALWPHRLGAAASLPPKETPSPVPRLCVLSSPWLMEG